MFRRIAALAAVPALTASALLVPSAAQAAGPTAAGCNVVPLKFTKSYAGGGERWQTKASLQVRDLCAAGTIRGKLYLRGTGGTTESDLSPYKVNLHYKRQLDTAFTSAGVNLKKLARQGDGWRPYSVTTEDIVMVPSGGYFIEIRVRWTVHAGAKDYTKSVVCDRFFDKGDKAYSCT
jgi:hypothetical protein